MKITETSLKGVLLIEPGVFTDHRGYFYESFHAIKFAEAGLPVNFVQDNVSHSKKGVLRGLHYQHPAGQAKLVSALQGEIFDVAVDIRLGSPTYAQWVGEILSEENHRQLLIPEGFAHGFLVLSETATVSYKCSDFYVPADEGSVAWNDPDIGIVWPSQDITVSARDAAGLLLRHISPERLPRSAEYRGADQQG